MQTTSAEGLRPSAESERRYEIKCVHNAGAELGPVLIEMLSHKSPREMFDVLGKPDVQGAPPSSIEPKGLHPAHAFCFSACWRHASLPEGVASDGLCSRGTVTNLKDKDMLLPEVLKVNERVRETFRTTKREILKDVVAQSNPISISERTLVADNEIGRPSELFKEYFNAQLHSEAAHPKTPTRRHSSGNWASGAEPASASALAMPAVLLFSPQQRLELHIEAKRDYVIDELKKGATRHEFDALGDAHFRRMRWRVWPRDAMMQRVAAVAEVEQLLKRRHAGGSHAGRLFRPSSGRGNQPNDLRV